MEDFINAFLEWFRNDSHSKHEDYYAGTLTLENLQQLKKEEFIDFFKQFAKEGGMIQSGGQRTTPQFVNSITAHYEEFRNRVLEPFQSGFDLDKWLEWIDHFHYFGRGLATIFLNRVNKHKYVVVNDKSKASLKKLGYTIRGGSLINLYHAIETAETGLLKKYPILENFFRIDAMMHYLSIDEGKRTYEQLLGKSYFDLERMRKYAPYFGAKYDSNSPAKEWYKETQKKLEYLVSLLGEELNRHYSVNYRERPNTRPDRNGMVGLKTYVLTGFSPEGSHLDGKLFIKLAFHHLNETPFFDVEIDVDTKIKNNPFITDREKRVARTRFRISVDQNFPDNWQDLVKKISGHVERLTKEYMEIIQKQGSDHSKTEQRPPLNQIFYGPPGTGKTYETVNAALDLMKEDIVHMSREEVKQKFAEYQKKRRIFFTSFHQNMAYEDFIEGIKPVSPEEDEDLLKYEIQDGLFMHACVEATFNFLRSNFREENEVKKLLAFNELFDKLYERISNAGEEILKTKSGGEVRVTVTSQGNFSIKHSGSEKTYTVSRERLSRIYERYPDPDEIDNIQEAFRNTIGGCNSTAYWSILNAIADIRKDEKSDNKRVELDPEELSYEDKRKIVKSYWDKNEYKVLEKDLSHPYVFIIDEINRGNVAQIFGELISLIEDDKRMGREETLYAELPYSKSSFAIPPNLYIIGTMNTADRSVEALDTALRRRFSFIHMPPKPEELGTTEDGIDLERMLEVLNNRLSILKDHDHTLGHAWFWNVNNVEQLKVVFKDKILPLLQEFFYNDYEKLGLVLGDAFFEPRRQVDPDMFASFSGGDSLAGQYAQSYQYRLKSIDDLDNRDFRSLENQKPQSPVNEEQ